MTFTLTMSPSDLLLLLPEIFLTCWLCLVLIVDFSFPRLPKEHLAYLSIAGLLGTLACLALALARTSSTQPAISFNPAGPLFSG